MILTEITRAEPEQGHFFMPPDPRAAALMEALDRVYRQCGMSFLSRLRLL